MLIGAKNLQIPLLLMNIERVIEGPFPTFDLYQETKIGTKLYLIFIILSSVFSITTKLSPSLSDTFSLD